LTTFDKNLLTFWFDTGEGEQLKFEGLAICLWVKFDFIFFALMFNND